MLFEIKDVDKKTYEDQIRDFMPEKVIDMHAHIWLDEHRGNYGLKRLPQAWSDRITTQNPIEDLFETYHLMFPDKKVTPLLLTCYFPEVSIDSFKIDNNEYVRKSAEKHNVPALIFSHPTWPASELEDKIIAGKYLGVKAYHIYGPDYIPISRMRIFDFFPHHHLEVLNRYGLIMLLHVPGPGRIKDPVNLGQLLEIEKRYPNIKLVVAHVGCTYYPEAVGNAFEILAKTKNLKFEISANTCAYAFEKAIRAFGPKRFMFGADMPISRMRMRRISENGSYVNIVPKGLYGDVSDDQKMREVEGDEAEALTFFIYEEIKAFRQAAEKTGLSRGDIEDVFYNNSRELFDTAGVR